LFVSLVVVSATSDQDDLRCLCRVMAKHPPRGVKAMIKVLKQLLLCHATPQLPNGAD